MNILDEQEWIRDNTQPRWQLTDEEFNLAVRPLASVFAGLSPGKQTKFRFEVDSTVTLLKIHYELEPTSFPAYKCRNQLRRMDGFTGTWEEEIRRLAQQPEYCPIGLYAILQNLKSLRGSITKTLDSR